MAGLQSLKRAILLIAGNVMLLLVLLLLFEGGASVVLFARDLVGTRPVAERLHTMYDAELGWVNQRGVSRRDMYGPGLTLTTNARGFRGTAEVDSVVPAGKLRMVCSGDSFTLGYGVADADTWCHYLTRPDPRLEAVNMGQGGYGFDQAYLWYMRDGRRFEHNVQVFAFISDDFRRMEHAEFLGYAKPVLVLEGDSFRQDNVPVPQHAYGVGGWFVENSGPLGRLRVVQFARRLRARNQSAAGNLSELRREALRDSTREIVARVLDNLKESHEARGSRLVLVLLPTSYELAGSSPETWREFLSMQAARLGVRFVDLFPAFQEMSDDARAGMFIRPGEVSYPSAEGHFSKAGNARVAEMLYPVLESELGLTSMVVNRQKPTPGAK